MEIGDGRCFATSLSRSMYFSLSLSLSLSLRLRVFPCLSSPSPHSVFTHRPHRTLRPSSCTESHTHIDLYTSTHTHIHIYAHVRSASRVFAYSVYHPSILSPSPFHRSVPSSLLFVPLMGYHICTCPDLKIVRLVPGRSP